MLFHCCNVAPTISESHRQIFHESKLQRCIEPRNLLLASFSDFSLIQFILPCCIFCIVAQIMIGVCTKYAKIRGCLGPSLLDEIVSLSCAHPLIFHQISHQKSNTVNCISRQSTGRDTDAHISKMYKHLLDKNMKKT